MFLHTTWIFPTTLGSSRFFFSRLLFLQGTAFVTFWSFIFAFPRYDIFQEFFQEDDFLQGNFADRACSQLKIKYIFVPSDNLIALSKDFIYFTVDQYGTNKQVKVYQCLYTLRYWERIINFGSATGQTYNENKNLSLAFSQLSSNTAESFQKRSISPPLKKKV